MDEMKRATMRVLHIGNQPAVGEAIQRALAGHPDLELHCCRDATAAMAMVAEVEPMVILQEHAMPAMNAIELLTQCRHTPGGADIPIVIVSTTEDGHIRSNAFACGASDYLTALPDTIELVARLRYHGRAFTTQLQLRRTHEQLEATTRATSDFLAYMSHAVRTPMSGLIGMSELLTDTRLDPEQRSYVDVLRRSADALVSIVNDVVDLSKIEAGTMRLDSVDLDPRSVVDDVHACCAAQAAAKGLNLVRLIQEGTPTALRGDPGRLRQILTTLVDIAIKFTGHGEIVIRMEPRGITAERVSLRFEVSDSGIGMSHEQRSLEFEALSQPHAAAKRRSDPAGLGLALSKHFVELMGGDFGFDRQPGGGSLLWFTAQFDRVGGAAPALAATPRTNLRGVRALLVIDPEDAGAGLLSAAALSWGMTCDLVAPAEIGGRLDAAAQSRRPYDLVVMDMTVDEALLLAPTVHRDDARRAPVLVLLTLGGLGGHADTIREAGITSVLVKPVSQEKLYRCFTTVLGTAEASAPVALNELDEPGARRRRPRVLVVDDNEVTQITAVRMFDKLQVDADIARDGHQAIAACQRFIYDFVLMDCEMPAMDGFAATGHLRRLETGSRRLPIVAVTANTFTAVRERCLAAGMDDYMPKPVRLADLREMVARWTDHARADAGVLSPVAQEEAGAIDFNVIDELRDIDTAFVEGLIRKFSSEVEARIPDIRMACVREDSGALARLGHLLRGSSLTVGATGMADICAALEQSASAEDFDRGAVLERELEREFERVCRTLRNRMSESPRTGAVI